MMADTSDPDFCASCQLDYVEPEPTEIEDDQKPAVVEIEETITKKDALEGNAKIPVRDIFGFVIEHIAKTIGEQMGAGNEIDRNFTFFEQLKSRKRFQEIEKYTFLHPLVTVEKQGAPLLIAVEPYNQCKDERGALVDCKTWSVYELSPILAKEPKGLLEFHDFFEKTIRTDVYSDAGLRFAHVLKSISECEKKGFIHFTIERSGDEKTAPQWVFQYYERNLFIYRIHYNPPFEAIEMSYKSPWISTTETYFKRQVKSFLHFSFDEEQIKQILEDPEVEAVK